MNIVQNQRVAFLARAQDDARRLASSLANLSDAQRAAILALIAAQTSTPVDLVMLGTYGDWREASQTIDSHLRMTPDHRWMIGSGCEFIVEPLPGEADPHE